MMKTRKRSRLKVMLVDDDPDRAANVRAALEANGCVVVSLLASPLEIYDAVVDIAPDVIIIDTESPSRDSLESLAFISRDRPHPIVICKVRPSNQTASD